jgi:hypothetical protein
MRIRPFLILGAMSGAQSEITVPQVQEFFVIVLQAVELAVASAGCARRWRADFDAY